MLKVLLLPLNYSSTNYNFLSDIFKQVSPGAHVEIFDYMNFYDVERNVKQIRKTLIERVRDFKPDLLICQIQHTSIICGETIRACKQVSKNTVIVNYSIDCRQTVPVQYQNVGKFSDFNLICSSGQIDMYKNAGLKNVKFWHVGYNPEYHFPEPEPRKEFEFDVVFIANVNTVENYPGHNDRIETVKLLYKTFGYNKFAVFGSGWEQFGIKSHGSIAINDSTVAGYHRGFCNVSISHLNYVRHYFSDRLLYCSASGKPCISWYFPGIESYFQDGVDLLIANSPEDIVNKVKYLLENPEYASYIGINAANKCFAEHTYYSRINELLDITGLRNK